MPSSLPYTAAVSMLRYPARKAVVTTSNTSSGGTWNTPNPSWGMTLPSLSTIDGTAEVSLRKVTFRP
ncbi:Uncharacterised protein [Mycobacteroides abscessus subsp. abscessus]|nr:Uncharacterised protein [Mycobacteroides abscessus subsp. abscessus]